jgi:hypothetical protein
VELKVVGTAKRNSSRLNQDGTVKITTKSQGETKAYTITSSDDSADSDLHYTSPRMKLRVHRLNVQGGGTFKLYRENDNEAILLSLEWLEPASPSVNLFDKILTFDCPCCRATEPVRVAFEATTKETTAECPVCMDTIECRVLSCGHAVCEDCWGNCRLAATRVLLDLADLNEADVEKERAERDRLFHKKRNRDDEEPSADFLAKFQEIAKTCDTISGLNSLKWELMVENPALWLIDDVIRRFGELPREALQVCIFFFLH